MIPSGIGTATLLAGDAFHGSADEPVVPGIQDGTGNHFRFGKIDMELFGWGLTDGLKGLFSVRFILCRC